MKNERRRISAHHDEDTSYPTKEQKTSHSIITCTTEEIIYVP